MKKSLIALAVMGLSGVAMAQSSVTLYGVADAAIGKVKYNSGPAVHDNTNRTEFLSGGTMNNGPSRLGVRGTEDMGGGMSAGFNFEQGIDLNNGQTGAASLGNGYGAGTWGRQANMWLSGPWGTLKLGRQFTPSYLAATTYDLTGTADYSLQGLTYGYAGIGVRAPSAFAYVTPTFSGVTAALAYVTKSDINDVAGINKAAWDAVVLYANGPLSGGLAINKVATSRTNFILGAKYALNSNFALAASYTQASKPVPVGATSPRRRGFTIGGTATFGSFSATLDLSRDTKNEWGPKKYTNGVVELKYNLSKRTFLYGVYLRADGSYYDNGIASFGSTNNYSIGVRHNF